GPARPSEADAPVGGRAELFAYLSVGELAAGVTPPGLEDGWIMGENRPWNSRVMDLTNPGWRRYLVEVRIAELHRRGYRGLFLDTLDSYQLAVTTPEQAAAQASALVAVIRAIHRRYPDLQLIANRGFEVMSEIHPLLVGVVAESLFDRWDAAGKRYVTVPEADRQWLLAKLREIRTRYRLPVTVIDYRPPEQRVQARATARRIAALGFAPWVTNSELTAVGVGQPEVVPRRLLVLYDSAGRDGRDPQAVRLLGPVIEHLGYVPDYRDVRAPLPREPAPGRYAGVVSWLPAPLGSDADRYCRWLLATLDHGVRVAVLGDLGFVADSAVLRRLGLARASRTRNESGARALTAMASSLLGFEAKPVLGRVLGPGIIAPAGRLIRAGADQRGAAGGFAVHLRIADSRGPVRDPVLVAPWGGLALSPYLLRQGYQDQLHWVIDPFAFLTRALDLPALPAPDVTTEHGRRLLMVHVHGDGAERRAEVRGRPRAGAVVRRLIAASGLPHSTDAPALAAGLAWVVRRAHNLHGPGATASRANASLTRVGPLARPRHLPTPRSAPGLAEVTGPGASGSPSGKRPRQSSDPVSESPTSSDIVTTVGGYADIDVQLPISDENGYRVDDSGAPFGFRRVIETLEFTDGTRRLAPIAIVYHAHTGATAAGVSALEAIYNWLSGQEVRPVYIWDYAARVRESYRAVLTRDLDGETWHIHGLRTLRTVRIPADLGWPVASGSSGAVSVSELPSGRYITFVGAGTMSLKLGDDRPAQPIIVSSNAEIVEFAAMAARSDKVRIRLRARSPVPIELGVGNLPSPRCALVMGKKRKLGKRIGSSNYKNTIYFHLRTTDTGPAVLEC
ncbi:MAG: endo alpha-1,4 polygalactosaminidase, partial [Myxococcota bacterium]